MAAITWDGTGERKYESGVSHGVLYPMNSDGTYATGVAWNGLISVSNSPDGAEPNELWADNMKYAILRSAETLSLTIEAYTYPPEFEPCDGMVTPSSGNKTATGMIIGQQARQAFGFCYRTEVGTDANNNAGYKLHLVYGCTATPSDKDYETINDNPDAITFSWDIDTVPYSFPNQTAYANYKPVSEIVLDSIAVGDTKMAAIEALLYGGDNADPQLPTPVTVISTLTA